MTTTTLAVKIEDDLRTRLKRAAELQGCSTHALAKHAIQSMVEALERTTPQPAPKLPDQPQYFLPFARSIQPQSRLRTRITEATRRPEEECLPLLLSRASVPTAVNDSAEILARQLVTALRAKQRHGGVEGLIHEFALSSQEGVALMCLAEALLRIPDRPTRDALIRDKISAGDWRSHLGHSPSLFVNAATWGLVVTGKLTATSSESGLSTALTRLIGRGGEPVIRKGVDMAMRMMGEQFVTGQTISEALANSRGMEARGFRYSYDMLGEAATTAADAARYYGEYEQAIHAIGTAAARRGIYEGPGISIKLSALHPRYSRAQRGRVIGELLPRLRDLAILARSYDIGVNIDAEEADRLDLSLDLLACLCDVPELAGWHGLGFVVQAYQKRAPFVLEFLIDLARRTERRLMIRLVKGAYWDSEIKRAQVDGLDGFPVFTRKVHTDVSYLACARMLLAAPDAVFPQFATHNARTLAAVYAMAGPNFYAGQYEFQCLHGMGEPLYEEVVGREKLGRPCRIYAPVGTHETLLAYLVRRLLENGANSSFVNRIGDPDIPIDALIEDPVAAAQAISPVGAAHPAIALPLELFGAARANSAGLDLANEQRLAALATALLSTPPVETGDGRAIRNPADTADIVGYVVDATQADAADAVARAVAAGPVWQSTPPAERAACLERAGLAMEAEMPALMGLVVREAGKTLANAVGEIREAVDFLRYYARQIRASFDNATHRPLGPVVCISPWNFPLAIFTGQVAAALAAGNTVLAKPAEETPLVAREAVRLLHAAGIPEGALQLVQGAGEIGAALVGDARSRGVMFTGSTEVARLIQADLATRLTPEGHPIPLIAETGGQNALVVDSSALAEQVVADVLVSACDSAGQRCSALRVLCLQEDIADRVMDMLRGAMAELVVGNPDRLETDVGPLISLDAQARVIDHIGRMHGNGHMCRAERLPEDCARGHFVSPTMIEIGAIREIGGEVFGPVLHVMRFERDDMDSVIDEINATGYGLTFGVHSRIDETIDRLVARCRAGNIYVNRNLVGAVVGVQPFGGHGLSGTGPKAGGPLYLRRLLSARPPGLEVAGDFKVDAGLQALRNWLVTQHENAAVTRCDAYALAARPGLSVDLPGPVGESNVYTLNPRGLVQCRPATPFGLYVQLAAVLATGNMALVEAAAASRMSAAGLPIQVGERLVTATTDVLAAVLYEGDAAGLRRLNQDVAQMPGPIIPVFGATIEALASGTVDYPLDMLMLERVVSTNTAAAGGNASLMAIG